MSSFSCSLNNERGFYSVTSFCLSAVRFESVRPYHMSPHIKQYCYMEGELLLHVIYRECTWFIQFIWFFCFVRFFHHSFYVLRWCKVHVCFMEHAICTTAQVHADHLTKWLIKRYWCVCLLLLNTLHLFAYCIFEQRNGCGAYKTIV